MNITLLSEKASEELENVIREANADIAALVTRCAQESERQGKKVLPRLSFTITIEGGKLAYALSYGARVKRSGVAVFDEDAEEPGQEKMELEE